MNSGTLPLSNLIGAQEAFSKLKHILHRAQARAREALAEAVDATFSITATDAEGLFGRCGYCVPGQLPNDSTAVGS